VTQILQENPPALVGSPAVAAVDRVIRPRPREEARRAAAPADDGARAARDSRGDTGGFAVRPARLTRLIVLPFRVLRPDPGSSFLGVSLPDAITSSSRAGLAPREIHDDRDRFAADAPTSGASLRRRTWICPPRNVLRAGRQVRSPRSFVEARREPCCGLTGAVVDLGDVFHLEDELVRRIVGSLSVSGSRRAKTGFSARRAEEPPRLRALSPANKQR